MSRRKRSQEARELIPFLANVLNGQGGAARTVIRTTESGGSGVSDHGALTGLGDDDHSQYLRVDGVRAMSGNLNLADNDITNVRFINGLLLDDFVDDVQELQADVLALEGRTVLGGDGILSDEVTLGVGSPTLTVDVTDLIGAGLTEDGSNNLMVRAGDGIALSGNFTTVDEDFDFHWTGRQTWADTISSATWVSGDLGTGWGVTAAGVADFREIYSEAIIAKAFVVDATIVEKGSLTLTPARATLAADFLIPSSGYATLTVYDIEGVPGAAAFVSGTYVRLRVLSRASGLVVGDAWGTVSTYADQGDGTQTWRWTYVSGLSGITVYAGAVALGYGSSGSGLIDMTTVQANSPYLDVKTWTTSPVSGSNYTTHLRLGNLAGISDPDIGGLSGWGLYTDQLVARGTIIGADGDVVIDTTTGANLQARANADEASDPGTELNWTTNPLDPASGRDVARILGFEYTSGGLVTHNLTIEAQTDLADNRSIVLKTEAVGSQQALIGLYSGASANRVLIQSVADSGGNGQIDLFTGTVITYGTIRPSTDLGASLGTGTYRFYELHVDTLYVGTVSSLDTGHNHNNLYYQKSEIATLLAGYAVVGHTHEGYATMVWVATQLDAYALDGHDHDEDYYSQAYLDTEFDKYALVGHAHDTRYYQKSEITTLLSGYVTPAALAVALADYVTSTALTTALLPYVTSTALSDALEDYALVGHSHTSFDAAVTFNDDIDVNGTAVVDDLTVNVAATLDRIIGAEVSFEDGSGAYAKITSTGIDSLRPAFSSGVDRSGLRLTWTGDVFARDISAVNLSTFVFEKRRVAAVGGTLAINEAGKLYADLALTTIGATVTVDVADADAEGVAFDTGDILRISGLAYAQPPASSSSTSFAGLLPSPFLPAFAVDGAPRPATAYLRVTGATANSGYVRYTAVYEDGPVHVKFLKGTGLVRWSGGMITLTSTGDPYGPYIDIFNAGSTPWVAGSSTHYARIGRIDGLGVVSGGEQYGFVFSADADDATAARIAGSSLGTFQLFKTGIIGNDGAYNTFQLDPDGTFKLGTNVDADATTFVEFNPSVDEGAYASLIVRARLQSTKVELPLGEIAVYTAEDLFTEGYTDYWTSRMNQYGFQITSGTPYQYTTVSPGIHRYSDQGYEIRSNSAADAGTPSEYPIYRVSASPVVSLPGYVADDEVEDYGTFDGLTWNAYDSFVKHLAMVAPDAIETDQQLSTAAQIDFGIFNLATRTEHIGLKVRVDEDGYGAVTVGNENIWAIVVGPRFNVDAETTIVSGNLVWSGGHDAQGDKTRISLLDLPLDTAGLAPGDLYMTSDGTVKVVI